MIFPSAAQNTAFFPSMHASQTEVCMQLILCVQTITSCQNSRLKTLSTAKQQVLLKHLLSAQTDSSDRSSQQQLWKCTSCSLAKGEEAPQINPFGYIHASKSKSKGTSNGELLLIQNLERSACKGKAAAAYGTCSRRYSPALNKVGVIFGDQFNTLLPWSNLNDPPWSSRLALFFSVLWILYLYHAFINYHWVSSQTLSWLTSAQRQNIYRRAQPYEDRTESSTERAINKKLLQIHKAEHQSTHGPLRYEQR